MSMEKEALTHKIEDDLALRNRNWDKISTGYMVESGSNTNGSFVKFNDGTMICYIRGFKITGNGSVYVNSSVPLPADFIDVNYTVNVTPTGRYRVSDGGGQSTKYFNATVVSQYSDTIGNLRFMYGDGSVLESTFEFEVNIMAIGRWK
jgi:hypothetical protein